MVTVLVTLLVVAIGLWLLALFAAGYVALHPFRSPVFFSPGAMGLPQETFDFDNAEGTRLRATWTSPDAPVGAIVAAHGYCMNRAELAPFTAFFAEHGLATLLFDFRSHGQSARGRTGIGTYERIDVVAAVVEARRRVPGGKIVLLGSSMGAAASGFAAGERRDLADAIILDSSYDRLFDAAEGWWNFLGMLTGTRSLWRRALWPVVRLARPFAGFDPKSASVAEALRGFERPVLILHGREDTIAPPFCAERIAAATATPAEIVWFEGCDHSEMRWLQPDAYREALARFFTGIGLPKRENVAGGARVEEPVG